MFGQVHLPIGQSQEIRNKVAARNIQIGYLGNSLEDTE